jgi:Spy/CpxP family protein refolding chaperone
MKHRLTTLTITAAITAAALAAQGQGRPPEGAVRTPADFVQTRVDFLTGSLSLNDLQKKDALAIFTAATQAGEAIRQQFPDKHKALREAVKNNATDSQIDALAADLGALQAKQLAIQTKAEAKFYALLTKEQKDKFDNLRPMGPGGPGGPGGRGGPGRGPAN